MNSVAYLFHLPPSARRSPTRLCEETSTSHVSYLCSLKLAIRYEPLLQKKFMLYSNIHFSAGTIYCSVPKQKNASVQRRLQPKERTYLMPDWVT